MELLPGEAERVAAVMGGLATPTRVRILARLLGSPATVGQLTDELGLGQAAVSNHLRVLRHLGLAAGDRQGRNVIYRLEDEHVAAMIQQILTHARH